MKTVSISQARCGEVPQVRHVLGARFGKLVIDEACDGVELDIAILGKGVLTGTITTETVLEGGKAQIGL
jgi:hypothetical protein